MVQFSLLKSYMKFNIMKNGRLYLLTIFKIKILTAGITYIID